MGHIHAASMMTIFLPYSSWFLLPSLPPRTPYTGLDNAHQEFSSLLFNFLFYICTPVCFLYLFSVATYTHCPPATTYPRPRLQRFERAATQCLVIPTRLHKRSASFSHEAFYDPSYTSAFNHPPGIAREETVSFVRSSTGRLMSDVFPIYLL